MKPFVVVVVVFVLTVFKVVKKYVKTSLRLSCFLQRRKNS